MCGCYALTITGETFRERYGFEEIIQTRINPEMPRFTITPSQAVIAIIQQRGHRVITGMRWGFAPYWWTAKRPPPINARAETITERPTFRGAYRSQRCLLPADGFFEWVTMPGKRGKQPMRLSLPGDQLLSLAGIWTLDADGTPTCAIVTTAANDYLRPIHHRMPVVLERDLEALWLDPTVSDPTPCLTSTVAERLEIYPVSDLANPAGNDGPPLTMPLL